MTRAQADNFDLERVKVRQARDEDRPVLRELFLASLLEQQVPANDTGADIDNLQEAYFSDGGESGFWVATYERLIIVGMIGVQRISDNSAEVRRLRVRDEFRRRGIGSLLMREAIAFCQRLGYLKVVLDVRTERGPALAMFEKFGFRLARTREVDGRKMLDFYLDLYSDPNA